MTGGIAGARSCRQGTPRLAGIGMAGRIRVLRRPCRNTDDHPVEPASDRHGRSAFPVLQHRNDRGYRRTILEALSAGSGRSPRAAAALRIGHRFEPVPVPAADRSFRHALAKTRSRAGARLYACQRHLGQQHLFRRSGRPAAGAAAGFQRRPDPPAMARRRRLLASGGRADRDLVRGKSGHPRRRRRLEAGSGRTPPRLYQLDRRPHRRRRIHERTEPCRDGRRTGRLRRGCLCEGFCNLPRVDEAES